LKLKYEDHIERRPDVQGGRPVIKGTDVLVRDVMVLLAEGRGPQEIRKRFPELTLRDVRAVLAFAALAAD
jgi:uncharacterized protein (DUF433 family)